jgi:hypothetical protein
VILSLNLTHLSILPVELAFCELILRLIVHLSMVFCKKYISFKLLHLLLSPDNKLLLLFSLTKSLLLLFVLVFSIVFNGISCKQLKLWE